MDGRDLLTQPIHYFAAPDHDLHMASHSHQESSEYHDPSWSFNQDQSYDHSHFKFWQDPFSSSVNIPDESISEPPASATFSAYSQPWPSTAEHSFGHTASSSFAETVVDVPPSEMPLAEKKPEKQTPPPPRLSHPQRKNALTHQQRKEMCEFHEAHPKWKQAEIGARFGVERSTVSKVLRQKDKYLNVTEESLDSAEPKRRYSKPDIEKALSVWARNTQKKGVTITDNMLRDQAESFEKGAGNLDGQLRTSPNWLEKFKAKHLMSSKQRRIKAQKSRESISLSEEPKFAPAGHGAFAMPASPVTVAPPMSASHSQNSLKHDSPESHTDVSSYRNSNAQSQASLATSFDTQASSFTGYSTGPTSPVSSYSPDPHALQSPFVGAQPVRFTALGQHPTRPRSQTFPSAAMQDAAAFPGAVDMQPRLQTAIMGPPAMQAPLLSPSTQAGFVQSMHHHSYSLGASPQMTPQYPIGQALSQPPSFDEVRRCLDRVRLFVSTGPHIGATDAEMFLVKSELVDLSQLQSPHPAQAMMNKRLSQIAEVESVKMEGS